MPDSLDHPTSPTPDKAPAHAPSALPLTGLRPPLWSAAPRALWPIASGWIVALLLQLIVVPLAPAYATIIAFAGINILLAVSLNLVNGFAGQFSIGHAGFMSLGGYLGAAFVYYATYRIYGDFGHHGGSLSYLGSVRNVPPAPFRGGELLFLAGCVIGGLLSVAAGWLVGLPSLRLRGDYLAIVTLGFGEIVRVLLEGTPPQVGPYSVSAADQQTLQETGFLSLLLRVGGPQAFNGLPTYASPLMIFGWVTVVLVVAVRVKYSAYGRSLLSIREDEIAARSIGVDVTRYNIRAFMLSAFFAGVAGVLTALYVGQIKAGDLGFSRSFEIIIMVVLGGLGSVSGSVLAAVLLTLLPELLRDPPMVMSVGGIIVIVLAGLLVLMRARRKVRGLLFVLGACLVYEGLRWGVEAVGYRLSDFRMILYAALLVILMILRPQGLLGVHELWEVWPFNTLARLRRKLVAAPVPKRAAIEEAGR